MLQTVEPSTPLGLYSCQYSQLQTPRSRYSQQQQQQQTPSCHFSQQQNNTSYSTSHHSQQQQQTPSCLFSQRQNNTSYSATSNYSHQGTPGLLTQQQQTPSSHFSQQQNNTSYSRYSHQKQQGTPSCLFSQQQENYPSKFGASYNIHSPSSHSPLKTPLRSNQNITNNINLKSSSGYNNELNYHRFEFQTLEELSIKDLLKGDFSFATKYSPETQEKIFSKLLEDLNRVNDRVRGCMYDPYSVAKNYHLSQWVSEVISVASEYSSGVGSWGADNLIGPPQTFPRYGDISTAWAPLNSSGSEEYLHVKFARPVYVCGVDIFETWNPGCVVKISAFDGQNWKTLWTGDLPQYRLPELPRVFSPAFPCTTFLADQIRIDLDCTNSISWTEIDAIRLRGRESFFWTPRTHHRYPVAFRQIVNTFLLCVNRLTAEGDETIITEDVMFLIFKYLALDYIDC